MTTVRYRVVAEVELPAGLDVEQHDLERHFQAFVDDACSVLAAGAHRVDQGLFSVAPVPAAGAAQQGQEAAVPPPSPEPEPVHVSDTLSGRQEPQSRPGADL